MAERNWQRASTAWTALALTAAALPSGYLATRGAGSVGAWLFYAILVLAPATAFALRRRPDEYRSALVATLAVLAIGFVLGGIIIGVLYLPTLVFAVAALSTNALARRAG